MKKLSFQLIIIVILACFVLAPACHKDESPTPGTNEMVDPRDGQNYRTVHLVGLWWMADNLNFDIGEGCCHYMDRSDLGATYGRLYTLDAALAACPPGWHLSTDEEWALLQEEYGGLDAYTALMTGGESGFDAKLGGVRNPYGTTFALEESGLYWSPNEAGLSRHRFFNSYVEKIYNISLDRMHMLSCRCVKD